MKNWLKNLFKSKPQEIWKDIALEYLREQDEYSPDPRNPLDTFYVYAVTQKSISTGEIRYFERFYHFKQNEYNNL